MRTHEGGEKSDNGRAAYKTGLGNGRQNEFVEQPRYGDQNPFLERHVLYKVTFDVWAIYY